VTSNKEQSKHGRRPSKQENIDSLGLIKDRHILIAVDDTESSQRAVLYVADFLGDAPGFRATIFSLLPLPTTEFFESEEERSTWIRERLSKMEGLLETYRKILIQSGFPEEKVFSEVVVKESPSIAEGIMDEQQKLGSCTIVVARHGISREEEFLMGSTTNKLLHMPKNCSLWIIE
jgi:nucleotide-binding universal stress UspA family protein